MQGSPQSIHLVIELNDSDMRLPQDVASLLARLASAFDGKHWPVFEKLYDNRGNCVGRIELRYVHTELAHGRDPR